MAAGNARISLQGRLNLVGFGVTVLVTQSHCVDDDSCSLERGKAWQIKLTISIPPSCTGVPINPSRGARSHKSSSLPSRTPRQRASSTTTPPPGARAAAESGSTYRRQAPHYLNPGLDLCVVPHSHSQPMHEREDTAEIGGLRHASPRKPHVERMREKKEKKRNPKHSFPIFALTSAELALLQCGREDARVHRTSVLCQPPVPDW